MKIIKLITLIFSFSIVAAFGQETLKKDSTTTSANDTTIYTMVPTMPEFGITRSSLEEYIKGESKLPTSIKKTPATKNVFVLVIIEKTGKVTFRKIVRSPNDKLSEEAKRIAERMPNWSVPRLNDGTPARVSLMFPIWFESQ